MAPAGSSQIFPASYDSVAKVVSAAAMVLLVVIAGTTQSAIAGGAAMVLLGLAYAWSPRGYMIEDRSILVRRLIGSARIPLGDVREMRAGTADDFRGCIRLWASGGLFGYYGLFRTSKLGKCWWYVTNRRNAIIVVTDSRTTVLSPDDGESFMAAVRMWTPGLGVAPSVPDAPPVRAAGSWAKWIAPIFALAVLGLVALAMLYSPGPPGYTLTPASLAIHDRFYPVTVERAAVDIEGIRVVDIGTDPDWRPVERTNGFANGHYQSGWFRTASGKKVRMYRADSRRLVLLPPKVDGAPVLIEVIQPEKFAEDLRREWSPQP